MGTFPPIIFQPFTFKTDADWSRVSSDDFPGGHLEVLFIGPVMVSRSRGSLSSGQPRVINHWPWVSSGPAATIAGVLPFTFSTRALLCKVHIGPHHAHRRWPGIWDSTYNPLLPSLWYNLLSMIWFGVLRFPLGTCMRYTSLIKVLIKFSEIRPMTTRGLFVRPVLDSSGLVTNDAKQIHPITWLDLVWRQ